MMHPSAVVALALIVLFFCGQRVASFCTRRCLHRTTPVRKLFSSSGEEPGDRPPIIPFDFARDDIIKTTAESGDEKRQDKVAVTGISERKKAERVEDPTRPTGYDSDDNDDDWIPSVSPDDNAVTKFLKDYVLDNEYDSMKRKDAKFVVRNITLFSFLIGAIFTVIFYAFPGKFIGYKADMNFPERSGPTFVDPAGLLGDGNELPNPGSSEYFDDAKGLPPQEQTRFAIPSSSTSLFPTAPPRTEDI